MKKLWVLLFAFIIMSVFSCSFAGEINSVADAKDKEAKMLQLYNTDFDSFINKSELIGDRYYSFKMATQSYKKSAQISAETLASYLSHIDMIQNSPDYTDSDKDAQIKRIFMQMDTSIYDFDSSTLNFVMQLRYSMPSMSYAKFVRKFKDYYNSLGLTSEEFNPEIIK